MESTNLSTSKHLYIIPIYIQQGATLHSLFYLETALHVSGGTITQHQKRKQLYLRHLVFVRPLLLPASKAVGSSFGWWYNPKHVEQFPDKINCVTLRLVARILEYSYDAWSHERLKILHYYAHDINILLAPEFYI